MTGSASKTPSGGSVSLEVHEGVGSIPADAWDEHANPAGTPFNPFLSHAFLLALEKSGSVGGRTGWQPRPVTLRTPDTPIAGVAPVYVKSHSQGEYVFDHGWAEAFQRAGGRYYPKLQVAVPFTPVPGRRFLVAPGPERAAHEVALAEGVAEMARRSGVSSVHATFCTQAEWTRMAGLGYLQRTDQQFHWANAGYATFDDFLASLASRKRKAIRKERETALSEGITIRHVSGSDLTEAHWDAFFSFYMDTGSRKWGRPYLNRRFFSLLGEAMADNCLIILAERAGRPIAGALNLIGGDCLYGRYWGSIEHHPCLHFEVCYYQAIEYAIGAGLTRVEAGAQGEHKLARGYMPTPTYSLHWIADAGFRRAVDRYLVEERAHAAEQREMLAEFGPFRKVIAPSDA